MTSEKENSSPKDDMHMKKDKGGSAVLEIAAALIVAVIIIIWIQNLRVAREVEEASKDLRCNQIYHEPYRLLTRAGRIIWVEDRSYIYRNPDGSVEHYEGLVYDITERQEAKEEIKTLRGILPICMYCKEIRDEKGYWSQLEHYLSTHSDVEFSHGICEKCLQERFPE